MMPPISLAMAVTLCVVDDFLRSNRPAPQHDGHSTARIEESWLGARTPNSAVCTSAERELLQSYDIQANATLARRTGLTLRAEIMMAMRRPTGKQRTGSSHNSSDTDTICEALSGRGSGVPR